MTTTTRYFTTYTGIRLPFKLTGELSEEETQNRNTFFRGQYNEAGQLLSFQKMVYQDVEQEHRYSYDEDGKLIRAEIVDADGDVNIIDLE